MSYTYVLGGGVANTALVGYLSLPLVANTTLSWPISFYDTVNVVARTMDIVPTQNDWILTFPDARQTATGMSVLINNPSAFSFILHDNAGNLLQNVAAGTIRYILLVDNTTQGGTWRVNPWGGGIASVTSIDVQPVGGSAVAIQSAGGPIVNAGTIQLTVSPELIGLAEIPGSGYIVRTGAGVYENRILTAPVGSNIVLGNADGIADNTTIALSATPTGLTSIEVGNLSLVGNTFASTNNNGVINIVPNGNGSVNVSTAAGNINLVSGLNVNIGALSYPQTDNATAGLVPVSNGFGNLNLGRIAANNLIINGGFQIWNLGTTFSAVNQYNYGPDRWQIGSTMGVAATCTKPAGTTNIAQIGRVNGDTNVGVIALGQTMLISTCQGASKVGTVSVGFIASRGPGFSGNVGINTNRMTVRIITGTSTTDDVSALSTGFTGGNTNIDNVIPLNNVTDYYNLTIPIANNVTQMALVFMYNTNNVAANNDYLQLSNIQLNLGSTTSAFEYLDSSIVRKQCEFYTYKDFFYGTIPAQNVGINTGETTLIASKAGALANPSITIAHPQMRAAPSMPGNASGTIFYNPSAGTAGVARDISAGLDCGVPALVSNTDRSFSVTVVGNAGSTIGNVIGFHYYRSAELY